MSLSLEEVLKTVGDTALGEIQSKKIDLEIVHAAVGPISALPPGGIAVVPADAPELAPHLGRSDISITMLRRLWTQELQAVAEGRPIRQWQRPERLWNTLSATEGRTAAGVL